MPQTVKIDIQIIRVFSEVRRVEALDLIQSMISGHAGSLTSVQANTPRDAAIRLETLCLMSDVELPQIVARMQVASAIHLVVQIRRFGDGKRKVTEIAEALGLGPKGDLDFKPIFQRGGSASDSSQELVRVP